MTSSRDRQRGGGNATNRAPAFSAEPSKSSNDLADTSHLVIPVSLESDDADVLRAMLAYVEQGQLDIEDALTQLGADFFCEENGWRKLFVRLLAARGEATAFKRRALSDYLARLEALRGKRPGSGDSGATDPLGGSLLRPLVRGQPTPVRFDRVNRIECRLGQCVIWISAGSPATLAVTGQPSIPLPVGNTRIGRAPKNEVVLGERWPDVSRLHLLIEVTRARVVVLTDFSSHGTLVTGAAI